MADILLSSYESEGNIATPSFINGTGKILDNVQGSKPTDRLIQKLYIINHQLCVAVGGRLDQMFSFVRALKIYFEEKIPTETELRDFLDNYDETKKNNLIALVLHAENGGNRVKFTSCHIGEWKSLEHDLFEEAFACGSGRDDYLKELEFAFNNVIVKSDLSEPNDAFLSAISNSLLVFARFLGLESVTAQTLLKKWGAGFEIVSYVNGRFMKLDEITLVTMIGEKYFDKPLSTRPLNCLKFIYFDEALIIRGYAYGKEKIFCAVPIDQVEKYKSFNINIPDFNSNTTLLSYVIKSENNLHETPVIVILNNLERSLPAVKITVNSSNIEIMIEAEIEDTIETAIIKRRR